MTSDRVRQHADPLFLAAKQARWFEPHVAPVNRLVEQIAADTGTRVPYVDPDCGGVASRVLLLLEAPSGAAAFRSGMISADNDDATAANVWRAHRASGLARTATLIWNAVPWYLGGDGRITPARAADVVAGRPHLLALLELLPDLRVVLTLGQAARRAVSPLEGLLHRRDLVLLTGPHPSQRVYNRPDGRAREDVHAAFAAAARAATGASAPADATSPESG